MQLTAPTTTNGADRPDIGARQEIKYLVTDHDVATLRGLLRQTCRPVVHAGPVSIVRSLYFDTPTLANCSANLDGVGLRSKTRLRWYDRRDPGGDVFLEVKWRRHRVTGKHRRRIQLDSAVASSSLRTLHRHVRDVAGDDFGTAIARDTEPVLVVEYRREHFQLERPDRPPARLTLDYDLRFYPQLGSRRLSDRWPERLPGIVLIECKVAPGERSALHRVLGPLRTRPTRFSKYVTGCQRLGYVGDQ